MVIGKPCRADVLLNGLFKQKSKRPGFLRQIDIINFPWPLKASNSDNIL